MKSKHRSDITDANGYLLRDRPGWDVPVGSDAASLLGADLTDRETQILLAVERLGYATTEQIARAFFNSHRSAYETLLQLVNSRFLASLSVDASLVHRSVGHSPPPRNPVYILDWNGYYYLTSCCGYGLRNWRASTIAVPSLRLGHALSVSEVWSYMVAAARATQELDYLAEREDRWGYRLAVHFSNERGALLIQTRAVVDEEVSLRPGNILPDSAHDGLGRQERLGRLNKHSPLLARVQGRILLQPDGAFMFSIRELAALQGGDADEKGERDEIATGGEGKALIYPPNYMLAQSSRAPGVGVAGAIHPRWDPTLYSWESALLQARPSRRSMHDAEERAGNGEYGTNAVRNKSDACPPSHGHNQDYRRSDVLRHSRLYYRTLLLEMETGANSPQDVKNKISIYNRLLRGGEEIWTGAYGVAPRVLVVVRHDAQIGDQAGLWRAHYLYKKATAVLLTSLQTLARVTGSWREGDNPSGRSPVGPAVGPGNTSGMSGKRRTGKASRQTLLDDRCWLDVMASDPAWKSLGEALKIGPASR